MVGQSQPDVLILEVTQLLIDGAEATRRVSTQYPQTRVLALSVYRDEDHVSEMLRAGARGYLLQDDAEIDLVSAILGGSLGLAFLSPDIIGVVLEDWRRAVCWPEFDCDAPGALQSSSLQWLSGSEMR